MEKKEKSVILGGNWGKGRRDREGMRERGKARWREEEGGYGRKVWKEGDGRKGWKESGRRSEKEEKRRRR